MMNYDNLTAMSAYNDFNSPSQLDTTTTMMFDPRMSGSVTAMPSSMPMMQQGGLVGGHHHHAIPHLSTQFNMGGMRAVVSAGAHPSTTTVSEEEEDQPKRPLSAYNIFFQVERQRLISQDGPVEGPYTRAEVYSINLDKATRIEKAKRPHRKMHGRITFIELAKTIASKWKSLAGSNSERRLFEERANDEKRKYAIELEDYLLRQVPTQQIKKRLSALRRGSLSKYITGRERTASPPTQGAARTVSRDHSPASSMQQQQQQQQQGVITPNHSRRSSNASGGALMQQRAAAQTGMLPPHTNNNSATGGSSPTAPRSHLQMERGRNLERLYQMQITLYNEQMRIQAEYNREQQQGSGVVYPNEQGSSYEQQQQQHFHEVSPTRGFRQQQGMLPSLDDAPTVPNMFGDQQQAQVAPPSRRFVSRNSLNGQEDDAFNLCDPLGDDQPACHPSEFNNSHPQDQHAHHHEQDGRVSPLLAVDPFA